MIITHLNKSRLTGDFKFQHLNIVHTSLMLAAWQVYFPPTSGRKVRLQVSTGLCFPFLESAIFSSLLHLESICALNGQMNELLMHFSYFNG